MKTIGSILLILAFHGLAKAQNTPSQASCPPTLNISTLLGNDKLMAASSTITASNIIDQKQTVTYRAGSGIILSSNFWVREGATFHASIQECSDIGNPSADETVRIQTESEHFNMQQTSAFALFPNPTTGLVAVQGLDGIKTITLFDMLGNQLLQTATDGNAQIELNLTDYPAGMYVLKTDDSQTQRVVKY